MKDECINCGAWKGLHHYETNQCPRNGQEAPLGKLQEWDDTVYQEDNTADLRATIARLTAAHEMQGEELVTLPKHMIIGLEDKLKAQATEIETLKSILRDAEVEINIQTGGGNYSELLGNIRTVLTGGES